jgi:VWFA-related protein
MPRVTWTAAAVVAVALSAPMYSQAPAAQQPIFRSTTDLVIVDAVVVDKDGRAVRGLTASDFVLSSRKSRLTVETFEEVSHERQGQAAGNDALPISLKRDVASNTTVQADRLVMVFIDDLHIWRGRTEKAKAVARDVVSKLGPQASMAIVFSSREGSTEVTQDRSVLLAAIDGMAARQTFRRPHQGFLPQKAKRVDASLPIEFKLAALQEAQQVSLQEAFDNIQHFKTLEDAARMVTSEQRRRKAFVVISEGLDADLSSISAGGSNFVEAFSQDSVPNAPTDRSALSSMVDALRAANVTLYAIDPRGKVRPEDMMLESWPPVDCAVCTNPPALPEPAERVKSREDSQFAWDNPVRRAQSGLEFMAGGLGGFAITDTDDLTGGLNRILDALDHYYLLGFYPRDAKGGAIAGAVELTVPGHPDYSIRFRRGAKLNAVASRPSGKHALGDLASGILPSSDLPLRLTATPLPGADRTARVAVALEVTAPVGVLQEADKSLRDDVDYAVIVVDSARAKVTQRTGRSATFTLKAQDPSAAATGSVAYQIPLLIDLAPGRYQLRASAVSRKLGKGGSVYLDLTVPDFSKAALLVTPVTLGFADGTRVPVGRPTIPRPQSQNPLPFEPTLSREFVQADALRTYFEIVRRDRRTTASVALRILDATNQARLSHDMVIGPGDRGIVDLKIPLNTLAPGAYILRVTVDDSRVTTSTETGFVIR